jgi:hypothetical protein
MMCDCCGVREAETIDFRGIDGGISKMRVCGLCFNLKNEHWLRIHEGYGTEKAREELRQIYTDYNSWEELGIEPPHPDKWNPKLESFKIIGFSQGLEIDFTELNNWTDLEEQLDAVIDTDPLLFYPDEWLEYWAEKEEWEETYQYDDSDPSTDEEEAFANWCKDNLAIRDKET